MYFVAHICRSLLEFDKFTNIKTDSVYQIWKKQVHRHYYEEVTLMVDNWIL